MLHSSPADSPLICPSRHYRAVGSVCQIEVEVILTRMDFNIRSMQRLLGSDDVQMGIQNLRDANYDCLSTDDDS